MIAVRAASPADADAIAGIYAPHVEHGIASFEAVAPDMGVMLARMAGSGGLYPWLVAVRDGGVLGYAYACAYGERAAYAWAVETSVYVAANAQGCGVGRRLYAALMETLVAQGFTQAFARIALPNDGSVALHAAAGFAEVGVLARAGYKHGCWIDVGLWQSALAMPDEPPRPPTRFADRQIAAAPSTIAPPERA